MLSQAALLVTDPPQVRTKAVLARMLYQHRADLEEVLYSLSYLLKKRTGLLEEVEDLVGSLAECVDEEGPRAVEEEIAMVAEHEDFSA